MEWKFLYQKECEFTQDLLASLSLKKGTLHWAILNHIIRSDQSVPNVTVFCFLRLPMFFGEAI